MKKILVLCDFSQQTLIALDIAVQLANKISGSVRLLHVLNFPLIGELMNDYEHIEKWQDLTLKMEDRVRKKMSDILSRNFAGKGIVVDVAMGNVLNEILSYQKGKKFDLMVLGTKKTSGIGAHFFGSFTDRIIHKSTIPALAVNEEIRFKSITKIIVANAFKIKKENLSKNILKVKSLFSEAKIDIVRVNSPSDFMSEDVFDDRVNILKEIDNLNDCSFHSINHINQGNGLMYYASKKKANLIVVGDKHSSTLRRWIIGEDLAEHMMDFSNIPVLIL